jgi:DNA-binding MarR family transcriptional regulator
MSAVNTIENTVQTGRPSEAVFRALLRTYGLLGRAMQPYFLRFGITGSQWGVMRILHNAEGEGLDGLRQADLSERLLIRPPSVTGVLDRLQRQGLIARGSSPKDGRAKQVSLTDAGRQLVDRILVNHGARISDIFATLNNDEHGELHRLLELVNARLEAQAEREENGPNHE